MLQTESAPPQINWRRLCFHSLVGDPVGYRTSRVTLVDPALLDHASQGYRSLRKLDRVDPATTPQVLHELSFAMVWNRHRTIAPCGRPRVTFGLTFTNKAETLECFGRG